MALFGAKKEKKAQPKAEKAVAVSTPSFSAAKDVLLRPRVTEKASYVAEKQNAYVFDIPQNATKGAVKSAFIAAYKVAPIRVSMVKTPAKKVFSRGKFGKTTNTKKAYVYLKKGEKIEII